MLKCIRIRTCTKKKLKYNLKLFKFRKASQVLFSCQENAIIRGLWVISAGREGEKQTEAATGPSPERGAAAPPSPPQMQPGGIKDRGRASVGRRPQGAAGAFTPKTSLSSRRQRRTPSWKKVLPRAGPQHLHWC